MRKLFLLTILNIVHITLFAQIDTTDLLFYSKFDGNFEDLSSNRVGIIDSNITFTNDRFNNPNSAIFSSQFIYPDPTDIYLTIIDSSYFKNIYQNEFSISVWIKYANDGTYSIGKVVHLDDLLVDNDQFIDFGGFSWNDPNKPDYSEWHHFVWTTVGDSIAEYLDGELVRKKHKSTASNSFHDSKFLLFQELNGSADDLLIFKRSLSENEIYTLYSSEIVITNIISSVDGNSFLIPNPVSEKISLPENYEIVSLSSLSGQIQIEPKSNILSLHDVPPGIYILKFRTPGNYFTQKIIVK